MSDDSYDDLSPNTIQPTMSLVDYPDSGSDADDGRLDVAAQAPQSAAESTSKRKHNESSRALPPLPSAFHDLYATNARVSTSDNPSLHGGRKRAVPHVEGNWPSHVYLEWIPTQPESDALHSLIQHVKESIVLQNEKRPKKLPMPEIKPSLQSELGASLPLHVSLSRTLQIKTDDREPFLKTMSVAVRRCAVRAFNFEFQHLKWVPNFERNRWFLVLGIKQSRLNELNRLLQACNDATQYSGHPGLYTGGVGDGPMESHDSNDGPKRRKVDKNEVDKKQSRSHDYSQYFHVSIAWNLAEPDAEWTTLVQDIDTSKFIKAPEAAFDAVKVRVGNTVHNIALASKRPGHGLGKGGGGLGLG